MTEVLLQSIHKHYPGTALPALDQLSLSIPSGRITALLGASGSGKTTLLKIIAGLLPLTSGDVLFDGTNVSTMRTEERGAVMVFQNHLLFPHMTVEQNIGFGLKVRGVAAEIIHQRVAEMLALIQLPDVGKRRPHQLSGGQQQRIALARALIVEPRVLLLDEPLSNLDVHLRDEMRELIRQVQRAFGITTIIVTHDQQDAVVLADQIALMRQGRLEQYDVPEVLFNRPANEQVARFFGGVNFLPARVEGCDIHTAFGSFRTRIRQTQGDALLTIRPEHVQFVSSMSVNTLPGVIESLQFMGTHWRCVVSLAETAPPIIVHETQVPGQVGDSVILYMPPDNLWAIPPAY